MNVPSDALYYILLQRTQYSWTQKMLFGKKIHSWLMLAGPRVYKAVTRLESNTHAPAIRKQFQDDMQQEFEIIKNALPLRLGSILDIGCGVAGIDIYLYKDSGQSPEIYLLDKTSETEDLYFGFKDEASYYNSLKLARHLLELNGVPEEKIHTQEVTDKKTIDFGVKFDLIISLLSWGFHYPISTYLDQAYEALNPGGVLILDVRKGQGSEAAIEQKFGNLQTLFETPKMAKVKAVRL